MSIPSIPTPSLATFAVQVALPWGFPSAKTSAEHRPAKSWCHNFPCAGRLSMAADVAKCHVLTTARDFRRWGWAEAKRSDQISGGIMVMNWGDFGCPFFLAIQNSIWSTKRSIVGTLTGWQAEIFASSIMGIWTNCTTYIVYCKPKKNMCSFRNGSSGWILIDHGWCFEPWARTCPQAAIRQGIVSRSMGLWSHWYRSRQPKG